MYSRAYLITKAFVYFGYNYPQPKEFITYICKKCDKMYLYDHIYKKFESFYDLYGSDAVMNKFFVYLDEDLREALAEYAVKVYFPNDFTLTEQEKELLNIK